MQAHYDVIVIGAGIHGAGVAQAAASMGYKVRLLEQNAVAAGTSSRSSKLIHGGLRYLESGQFSLVRECLRERRILLELAPDLVHLLHFYIPVYQYSRRAPWQIGLGLKLYYALSGFDANARYTRWNKAQFQQAEGLQQRDLRALFQYYDAQTDDAALTRAVVRSAQGFGAELDIGAHISAIRQCDQGWRLEIQRAAPLSASQLQARCVVNASGPWVNRVNRLLDVAIDDYPVDLVQGTHILLQREAPAAAYYVESPQDRRAVFVLPWQGMSLVGTTETLYDGDPANVAPQQQEIDYLLACYNHYFPAWAAGEADICQSFAGLRVLPRDLSAAHKRKRDTVLLSDPRAPAYLSIYGGKLTAYRHTAERVMGMLQSFLPPSSQRLNTRHIKL